MLAAFSAEALVRTFFAVVVLSSFSSVAATAPWSQPFTADARSILDSAKRLTNKEEQVSVLLREVELSYDAAGLETHRARWIYRVNGEESVQEYGGFDLSWEPGLEEQPQFRVRVIQPDGKVDELDPRTMIDASPSGHGDVFHERKGLRGPLPNVRRGSIIEQQVVTRAKPSLFQKGTTRVFALEGPALLARLLVKAAPNVPLKLTAVETAESAPRISLVDGMQTVTAEWSDLPEGKPEEGFQPLRTSDEPAVFISTGASWPALAKAYAEVVDEQLKSSALLSEARGMTAEARDPLAKARVLTKWLRSKVRYSGLYFGEATVVPTSPDEVLKRGFGDCKDMSTALVGMLRQSGVKAHVAILRASGPDLERRAPGLGTLDHAIVYVAGPKPFFVDPTDDDFAPGAVLPRLGGRTVVVADAALADPLVRIPEASPADNGWRLVRDVHMPELNFGTYSSELRLRGSFVQSSGWASISEKPEALKEAGRRQAKAQFGCENLDDLAVRIDGFDTVVAMKASKCARIVADDSEGVVRLPVGASVREAPQLLLGSKDDDGAALDKRQKQFRWPVPFSTEGVWRVHAPFGFRAAVSPEKREWKLGGAKLTREVTVGKDGLVTVTSRFDTGARIQSAAEVEAFRAAYDKSGDEFDLVVKFERVAAVEIASGRVREGLAAYRAAMAAHPKEAFHRVQYASVLLQLGFAGEARKQAAIAVKLQPDWATGYRVQGWILQYDDVGRRFLKGWDRAGSIASLREAVKLGPDDARTRRLLADSLLYDESGAVMGADSLDEAIKVLREARKLSPDDGADSLLLVSLYRAGRYGECLSQADEFEDSEITNLIRISCTFGGKGSAAGFAEFEKRTPAAKRGEQAMRVAADLILLRHYGHARALRERYPSESSERTASLQARMLESLEKPKAALSPNDPGSPLLRLFSATANDDGLKSMTALLAPALREIDPDPSKGNPAAGLPELVERLGIPRSVYRDMMATALPRVVELQAKHGSARVELTLLDQQPLGAYVVKGTPGWLIRAMRGQREELAAEAMTRLQKGDLDGARLWLGWAMAEPASGSPESERARSAAWPKVAALDAPSMRLLAATLMVEAKTRQQAAFTVLDSAKELSPAERLSVDWAVASGTAWSREPELAKRGLVAANRLAAANPTSVSVMLMRLFALGRSGDEASMFKELDAAAERYANDDEVLADLASVATAFDDEKRTRALREAILTTGRATAMAYNNLAWALLFDEPPSLERAEELASKAVQLTQGRSGASLNTLAAVHAESGRGKTAYQLVLRTLQTGRHPGPPGRADWYVLGRIAEGYGMDDVARDLYAKSRSEEEKPRFDDVARLVDRRLRGLPRTAVSSETGP